MKIFWHRRDLRLTACSELSTLTPIYILDEKPTPWLEKALEDLKKQYAQVGVQFQILQGTPEKVFLKLKPKAVYLNIIWEPKEFNRDKDITEVLKKNGIEIKTFNENYLIDPREIMNKSGKPYGVFTPFWNQVQKAYHHKKPPKTNDFKNTECLNRTWNPTRSGATDLIKKFKEHYLRYEIDRNFPAIEGTSKMSPYLHYGQISPRELYEQFSDSECYIRELGWREFANYFLFHFPYVETENWNKKFDHFKWQEAPLDLERWKKGLTGYPIVDAGMRELLQTGWMHNRVRMIVASFLTKHLLIDWREGAKWFMENLHDADLASNSMNWQWVAGCGPDAAPYFRIFNPILQSQKFDKDGEYIKRYIPELNEMDSKWIHAPWTAPIEILKNINYPEPIVDHADARMKALALYKNSSRVH